MEITIKYQRLEDTSMVFTCPYILIIRPDVIMEKMLESFGVGLYDISDHTDIGEGYVIYTYGVTEEQWTKIQDECTKYPVSIILEKE